MPFNFICYQLCDKHSQSVVALAKRETESDPVLATKYANAYGILEARFAITLDEILRAHPETSETIENTLKNSIKSLDAQ